MFNLSLEGRHAIRVAVVLMVASVVALLVPLPHTFWIMLTALLIVQASIGATWARGWQRGYSTLFGVLLGGTLVMLCQHVIWLTYTICLLSAFFAVYFSFRSYYTSIFFVSLLVVFIFSHFQSDVWHVVVFRFVDTVIGIALAIAGSLLLWPVSAKCYFQRAMVETLKGVRAMVVVFHEDADLDMVSNAVSRSRIDFHSNFSKAKQAFSDMQYEVDWLNTNQATGGAMIHALDKIRGSLYGIATMFSCQHFINSEMRAYLMEVGACINELLTQLIDFLAEDCDHHALHFRHLPSVPIVFDRLESLYLKRNIDHIEQSLGHLYQACRQFRC